jgi:hypothetical protein
MKTHDLEVGHLHEYQKYTTRSTAVEFVLLWTIYLEVWIWTMHIVNESAIHVDIILVLIFTLETRDSLIRGIATLRYIVVTRRKTVMPPPKMGQRQNSPR